MLCSLLASSVETVNLSQVMPECDHEEADTRICVHVKHALENGCQKCLIRTVDTDVIIILIGVFFRMLDAHPFMELIVAFGMGKNFKHYNINELCHKLERRKCEALPFFHAFSGCDTTSQFHSKGKKVAWQAWKSFTPVTDAFLHVVNRPFDSIQAGSQTFALLEKFTCILFSRETAMSKVNELRQYLFSKKVPSMESLPPTQVNIFWN